MDQSDYLEFKKQANEGLQSAASQFDKAILTLSAGALALSLTFVKDIAPTPDTTTVHLLKWAWAGFIASIVLTLLSFHSSLRAFRRYDKIIDTMQADPRVDRETLTNSWSSVTIWLNALSLASFFLGTVLLTWSVSHNLATRGKNVSGTNPIQGGAVPPSAPVASVDVTRGAPAPSIPVSQPKPGTGAVPPAPPVSPPKSPPPLPRQK